MRDGMEELNDELKAVQKELLEEHERGVAAKLMGAVIVHSGADEILLAYLGGSADLVRQLRNTNMGVN